LKGRCQQVVTSVVYCIVLTNTPYSRTTLT